ncbi:hypothetical protein SLS56_005256 [Neofusicoccum ribis]|uniref:F-box domain-containing protein n=1 Tax=Neofusicoccum ribis TaxID=45134 RepID=A0ABR3SUN7_9PEZI
MATDFTTSLTVAPPTIPALGGIPNEIAERIVSSITRIRDLKSLNETCRDLRRLTLAALYKHVYIMEDELSPAAFDSLSNPGNLGLEEIRDVTVIRRRDRMPSRYNWGSFFYHMNDHKLQDIRVIGRSCQVVDSSLFVSHILWQRNLKHLDICCRYNMQINALQLRPTYTALTALTLSCCSCNSTEDNEHLAAIMAEPTNLRSLSINGIKDSCSALIEILKPLYNAGTRLRGLSSFSLSNLNGSAPEIIEALVLLNLVLDFSDIQTLIIESVPGSDFILGVLKICQEQDPKLKNLSIYGYNDGIDDLEALLSTLSMLERLIMTPVFIKPPVCTEAHGLSTLGKAIKNTGSGVPNIRTLCFDVRAWKTMSGRFQDYPDFEPVAKLLRTLPLLEELWINFPIVDKSFYFKAEERMETFLRMIAEAPRLRLLCNLRSNQYIPVSLLPECELSKFWGNDPWLHHTATTMLQRANTSNKALKVIAFGYLPCFDCQGRIRAFVRRPKLLATGQFETIVEEISAKELFLEEDFYFWDSFKNFEFEEQNAPRTTTSEEMDIDAT